MTVMKMIRAVNEYNCPGCVHGPNAETCPVASIQSSGCLKHMPGTMGLGIGSFALGLPRGFNRFGPNKPGRIEIFESYESMIRQFSNLTTIFSLPIWKYLDEHGNTIVRWYSPRTNVGWTTVILGDAREHLAHAMELTAAQLADMD